MCKNIWKYNNRTDSFVVLLLPNLLLRAVPTSISCLPWGGGGRPSYSSYHNHPATQQFTSLCIFSSLRLRAGGKRPETQALLLHCGSLLLRALPENTWILFHSVVCSKSSVHTCYTYMGLLLMVFNILSSHLTRRCGHESLIRLIVVSTITLSLPPLRSNESTLRKYILVHIVEVSQHKKYSGITLRGKKHKLLLISNWPSYLLASHTHHPRAFRGFCHFESKSFDRYSTYICM